MSFAYWFSIENGRMRLSGSTIQRIIEYRKNRQMARCLRNGIVSFPRLEGDRSMTEKLCILIIVLFEAFAAGCAKTSDATTNANANANTATTEATATTRQADDNADVMTKIDANDVKTEKPTFRNNPRVSKVVVTTKNGVKTAKVVSPSGEERDVPPNEVERALDATGEKVAAGAGFVADKTEDVAGEAGDKLEDAKDKTVSGAKTVGSKTVEGAKTAGSGAKKVAEKTASETKKAVKKIIP